VERHSIGEPEVARPATLDLDGTQEARLDASDAGLDLRRARKGELAAGRIAGPCQQAKTDGTGRES
jgi:hypothetical protein